MAIAVEGLRSLVKDLEQAGVALDDIKDVFAEIASVSADVMQTFVPVRSGDLRRSVRGNRAKNKAVVTAGKARVPYARVINYGWPARGIRPADFTGRTDSVMQGRAAELLESGLTRLLEKAGLDVG